MSSRSAALIEQLIAQRGRLVDRQGGWLAGVGVFSHGHDLLRDMLPARSYFHVLVLNALGYVPEDRFCKWLEAIFICLSWPDPRIWCNGVGALAGSARASTLAGTAAGMLASDSVMYGPYTLLKGVEFMQYAKDKIESGQDVAAFVESEISKTGRKVHLMGFARPIASGDERVEAMLDYANSLGYEQGPHLAIALQIEQYLIENYDESLNVGGYISAFLSDQGLSPQQVYALFPSMVNSGVTACHLQQAQKPDDSFLPQTCADVEYTGAARRELPADSLATAED